MMCPRRFHPERAEPPADYWMRLLMEESFDTPLPRGISQPGEGGKFTPAGEVLRFPGNTFICHIDRTSAAHAALGAMQAELKALPSAEYYTFLPADSFHMTVFCGVSGDPLGDDGWPEGVAPGSTLEQVNALYGAALSTMKGPERMTIRADGLRGGYVLNVEPADRESFDAVWGMRDRLADMTGLHRADHDTYQFHISLAYRIRWQPEAVAARSVAAFREVFERYAPDLQKIALGPVEFCTFETMYHFQTEAVIG